MYKITFTVSWTQSLANSADSMSNSVDPDQALHSVRLDLGSNFAKIISRQQKSQLVGKELKEQNTTLLATSSEIIFFCILVTNLQINLHYHAVWSAPLLLTDWKLQ